MTLLVILIAFTVLLVLVGVVGLAGLQNWGMIFMLPIIVGFTAVLVGGTTLLVMILTEVLSGASIRDRYGMADFWSGVLIVSYLLGGGATALVLYAQARKTSAAARTP